MDSKSKAWEECETTCGGVCVEWMRGTVACAMPPPADARRSLETPDGAADDRGVSPTQ